MAEPPGTPADEPEGWRDVAREAKRFLLWCGSRSVAATVVLAVIVLIVLWIW